MGIFDLFKRSRFQEKQTKSVSDIKLESIDTQNDDTTTNHKDSLFSNVSSEKDVDIEMINRAIDKIARRKTNYHESNSLGNIDMGRLDPLLEDAARLVVIHQQGSTSLIQRKFAIGYNRAGRIMDQLERIGIVGPARGFDNRDILCLDESEVKILLNTVETKNNFIINEDDYRSEIEERVEYYRKLIIQEQEEQERLFIESEKEKIKQQILEKQRKKELRKKAIEELREEGLIERIKKREPIPQDIQDAVWRRDNGRCVKCGSQENLEFDHIIPFSKGRSNSIRNLQLLCEKCNREKSNHIG